MKVQSTSTEQNLKTDPQDMPDRGGSKPTVKSSSTNVSMSRDANPVAEFGAKPGMGKVNNTGSTSIGLSREANSPYQDKGISETTPQDSFGGRGKR